MLEKDPSNRISAENALSHPYFYPDMDIEVESKPIFKHSISSPSYYFKSCDVETPTSGSRKRDEKYSYFNVVPKEVQSINSWFVSIFVLSISSKTWLISICETYIFLVLGFWLFQLAQLLSGSLEFILSLLGLQFLLNQVLPQLSFSSIQVLHLFRIFALNSIDRFLTEGQFFLKTISFILMSLKNISKESKTVGLDTLKTFFVEVT